MIPIWENPIIALDIRTTGPSPERHEICQLAAVELNSQLVPRHGVEKLILTIRPDHPTFVDQTYLRRHCTYTFEQLMTIGCDAADAVRTWRSWVAKRVLLPVCWQWAYIQPFMSCFIGNDFYSQPARDVQSVFTFVHDRHWFHAYNPGYSTFTRQRMYEACGVQCFDLKSAALTCLADVECLRHLLRHPLPN